MQNSSAIFMQTVREDDLLRQSTKADRAGQSLDMLVLRMAENLHDTVDWIYPPLYLQL